MARSQTMGPGKAFLFFGAASPATMALRSQLFSVVFFAGGTGNPGRGPRAPENSFSPDEEQVAVRYRRS